jgi:hypothetical protein
MQNGYTEGSVVVVPFAGVHALELRATTAGVVARLRTNDAPNAGYPARVVEPAAEITRLQQALYAGPAAFAAAMGTTLGTGSI